MGHVGGNWPRSRPARKTSIIIIIKLSKQFSPKNYNWWRFVHTNSKICPVMVRNLHPSISCDPKTTPTNFARFYNLHCLQHKGKHQCNSYSHAKLKLSQHHFVLHQTYGGWGVVAFLTTANETAFFRGLACIAKFCDRVPKCPGIPLGSQNAEFLVVHMLRERTDVGLIQTDTQDSLFANIVVCAETILHSFEWHIQFCIFWYYVAWQCLKLGKELKRKMYCEVVHDCPVCISSNFTWHWWPVVVWWEEVTGHESGRGSSSLTLTARLEKYIGRRQTFSWQDMLNQWHPILSKITRLPDTYIEKSNDTGNYDCAKGNRHHVYVNMMPVTCFVTCFTC